jgi:hypothetical protein
MFLPAPQFVHDRDANLRQMLGIADTGPLQDMGRADRARRQDHLAHHFGALDDPVGRLHR